MFLFQNPREVNTAQDDWSRVRAALDVLNVTDDEESGLWLILAAITNLGVCARQLGEWWFS